MSEVLQFALLGLGTGAVYTLLGNGLVLIYRGSGVLNLAQGAIAMFGAYLYYELNVMRSFGLVLSLIVVAIATGTLGAAVDQLLLRRLRQGSPLARLMGTLAVLLVLEAAGTLRYGSSSTLIQPVIPTRPIAILGTPVASNRLWLAAIAIGVTATLFIFTRVTRAGWVMSAVSENPRAAASLGWSPQFVSAATWAVGGALAGLSGVLISSVTALAVIPLSLLVIPALVAALAGGFVSFWPALAGGLGLGMVESVTNRYVTFTGASSALPVLLLVLILFIRGAALPPRGYLADKPPKVGTGLVNLWLLIPTSLAALACILWVFDDRWLSAASITLGSAVILLSIVVVTGYAGQLSLAQFVVAGMGALVAGRTVHSLGWPFEQALMAGIFAGALVGLLLALPARRTRGAELAAVTLAVGLAIQVLLFNNNYITGGSAQSAGTQIGSPHLFGLDMDAFLHPERYATMCLVLFILAAIMVSRVRRGQFGRRLLAVRANERAAAALGISVPAAKAHAFALGGALAGLGGVLISFNNSTIIYRSFDPSTSILGIAQAVVGSVGFLLGPLVGGTLVPGGAGQAIITGIGDFAIYLPLIGGLSLVLMLLQNPNGAVSNTISLFSKIFPKLTSTQSIRLQDEGSLGQLEVKKLELSGMSIKYGGVTAVSSLSLTIVPGEVVGLIGPNGAGKTSVIDAISGFTHFTGTVALDGIDMSHRSAQGRARAGIVRSFQSLELFEDMTVLENIQTAADRYGGKAVFKRLAVSRTAVLPPMASVAVREFGLEPRLHFLPAQLSYGQRRLVAIARAVAAEPSVLLLDEPVAGLDARESREFATVLRKLVNDWNLGVLLVAHDMDFVMELCDRLVVLDFGKVISSGTPQAVRADRAAIAAYLGDTKDA